MVLGMTKRTETATSDLPVDVAGVAKILGITPGYAQAVVLRKGFPDVLTTYGGRRVWNRTAVEKFKADHWHRRRPAVGRPRQAAS